VGHLGVSTLEDVIGENPTVHLLLDGFRFTEGPVWDPRESCFLFSDIPASTMYRWSEQDGLRVFRSPSNKTNGNTFDRSGRLISCEHTSSRVVRTEEDGTLTVLADRFDGAELNSPNDVIVDSSGRVYFTDPVFGRSLPDMGTERDIPQPKRGVYRIDVDGAIARVLELCEAPNGLCLSLDEQWLFVNDTATGLIHRFALQDGLPGAHQVWASPEGDRPGSVDGMKVDSAGNLYCTGPGGVFVYDGEGRELGVLAVPEVVGNFTWGGADLRTLFLCSSSTVYTCRVTTPGRALF
jgi:gluconolactonase